MKIETSESRYSPRGSAVDRRRNIRLYLLPIPRGKEWSAIENGENCCHREPADRGEVQVLNKTQIFGKYTQNDHYDIYNLYIFYFESYAVSYGSDGQ